MGVMGQLAVNARFLTRPATGVDRTATELLRALMMARDTAKITCHTPNAPIFEPEARPDILLQSVQRSSGRSRGVLWEQSVLPRQLHGDALLSLCNSGPLQVARQAVMIHDAQVFTQPGSYGRAFRAYYRFLLPRLARRASVVLSVSHFSAGELTRLGIVPSGKVAVVPNGGDHLLRVTADRNALSNAGLEPQSYILALGSLAPHKNLKRLVAAAAARPKGSLPLVLAGGGAPHVFAEVGLTSGSDVRSLGRVTEPALRALYEGACALAVPSLSEGFGLSAIEAMSLGCPVIASTGGALPETCGDAAMFVDPLDVEGWRAAMMSVQTDHQRRAEWVEKGFARARELTWARAAQALTAQLDPFFW